MNPIPRTDPTVAVTYRRVSSDEQTRGFGLKVQDRRNREFAKREGIRIAADFHEDISGTVPLAERGELLAAFERCAAIRAGVLLVADRDRLARDEFCAFDALRQFNAIGVVVLFADGYNGEGLAGNLGHLIAADDRRRTVARLRRGREEAEREHPTARKQGGRVPFGYRRVKHGLAVVDGEAEMVRDIFRRAAAGESQAKIAAAVGKSAATVQGIIGRDIYMRKLPARIVSPQVWRKAQGRQKENRRRGRAVAAS
jgi:site-specific DNA recombinase